MASRRVSRREALKRGLAGAAGLAAASKVLSATERMGLPVHGLHSNTTVGRALASGIDPHGFLREFDRGAVSRLPDGRTLREYTVVATERELEVAPGVFYPAW